MRGAGRHRPEPRLVDEPAVKEVVGVRRAGLVLDAEIWLPRRGVHDEVREVFTRVELHQEAPGFVVDSRAFSTRDPGIHVIQVELAHRARLPEVEGGAIYGKEPSGGQEIPGCFHDGTSGDDHPCPFLS